MIAPIDMTTRRNTLKPLSAIWIEREPLHQPGLEPCVCYYAVFETAPRKWQRVLLQRILTEQEASELCAIYGNSSFKAGSRCSILAAACDITDSQLLCRMQMQTGPKRFRQSLECSGSFGTTNRFAIQEHPHLRFIVFGRHNVIRPYRLRPIADSNCPEWKAYDCSVFLNHLFVLTMSQTDTDEPAQRRARKVRRNLEEEWITLAREHGLYRDPVKKGVTA